MGKLRKIQPQELVCMDEFATSYNYRVDLAYAQEGNLLFKERIYQKNAKLWLHQILAEVVKTAAQNCFDNHNLKFVLYDGLRTTDAQQQMTKTQRALDNPHWLEPPRLLSPEGSGGHPRGMAIDIGLETLDGKLIDMGTEFDYLSEDPKHNPAHREFPHRTDIIKNRNILDRSMIYAAETLNTPLCLLPEEWWDFRLPHELYSQYEPISESDIPQDMRLLDI